VFTGEGFFQGMSVLPRSPTGRSRDDVFTKRDLSFALDEPHLIHMNTSSLANAPARDLLQADLVLTCSSERESSLVWDERHHDNPEQPTANSQQPTANS
jgi:hypothetical protein